MNSDLIRNIWRFVLLVLLQGLVFKRISPDGSLFYYVSFIIFPLFIFLLPFRTPTVLLIFIGFLTGLSVDLLFYDSPGVHASACVFSAFIRPLVLQILEPKSGYNLNQSPVKRQLGMGWFLPYVSIMLFLHLFFYFSVEVFTFVYIGQILLKTILSFFFSLLFIIAYMYVFDPEE